MWHTNRAHAAVYRPQHISMEYMQFEFKITLDRVNEDSPDIEIMRQS